MVFWKQIQKNNSGSTDALPDTLPDLPVSLVLTSLIVVDIIEKLRIYPLRGKQMSKYSFKYTFLTSLTYNSPFCTLLPCLMVTFLREITLQIENYKWSYLNIIILKPILIARQLFLFLICILIVLIHEYNLPNI